MASKLLTIYISSDAIRVAEMQKSNKAVVLSNAAEVPTPQGCFNDGYLIDISAAAEAIRQAIFGRGFAAKEVVFTIASKKIASKEVEINYFKNTKKLSEVLQANSSEYFPMSGSGDYIFAYSILEDYYTEEGRKYRVSAVAAPVDLVRGYYELAEELKFSVNSIDYFGNSVIQLLSLQMQPGRTDLVLQIEKDATYVNVMRGPVLILQRSVNYGKNAVINTLMDVKKISEKDAKTLLSNERLLDQHVTADEYAETVQYLVNGIGRAVEYHRQKNPGEQIQGIKIFGEGSAIAGIEKILERELGAPVEHFETLAGVSIKGQAALTAEEVLRYLPNIGSVLDPMDLTIGASKKAAVSSGDLIKLLGIGLGVATVASGVWVGVTAYQHSKAEKERDRIQAEIDAIKDIEDIKNAYDKALAEYQVVNSFERSTHNDNEYLLQFINDLEELLPYQTTVNDVSAIDGDVTLTVTTGWHLKTKNEIADVMVQVGGLDYVSDFYIPSFAETVNTYFLIGYDENGEMEFLREMEESNDGTVKVGDYKIYDKAEEENYTEEELALPKVQLVQAVYDIHCHIGYPVIEEEEEIPQPPTAVGESAEAPAEEGGAD